jgi:methionyl-tRNA formyltransferase
MRSFLIGAVESTKIALEVMIDKGIKPIIVTLPLSHSYRHSDYVDLRPYADKWGLGLLETTNINSDEMINEIKKYHPDYIFVIGWSQIIKKELLNIPKRGVIGYHPAPLPRNRGRGVIPWTILLGEKETGSTLFWIDEGIDSGDILIQQKFFVDEDETARTLYAKHIKVLRSMMPKALELLKCDNPPRVSQDHSKATYCAKRTPEDGFINWEWSAKTVWTLIRAVTKPYPGAFTYYNNKKIIIWEASYIDDNAYIGLPGQIQKISKEGIIVTCGDGKCLFLKEMEIENETEIGVTKAFKIHDKFGINFLDVYKKFLEIEKKNE